MRRHAILGMKIRRFIDVINKFTKVVNRGRFISSAIYEVANHMTFAEIKNTVALKISPLISRMIGRVTEKEFV